MSISYPAAGPTLDCIKKDRKRGGQHFAVGTQNNKISVLQKCPIIFPSCEAPYKLPRKKETLLQSFGELYKGASLCYLLRNDANLFVCPHLLDLFVGEHICIHIL